MVHESSSLGTEDGVITFRYESSSVTCRADRSHLAWLREFLTPWFEVVDDEASDPAARVELATDDDAFRGLTEAGPNPGGGMLDVFALDRGMLRLPCWCEARGGPVVFDEPLNAFYQVDGTDGVPTVRVTSESRNPRSRIALMRVVRELAMSEVRAAGHTLLHAAVVATEKRGALIAGPKHAGKTTLLIHALRAGADFVSNDRAVLVVKQAGFVARGMPTIARIRQVTLDALPSALRAPLTTGRIDHRATRDEITRGLVPLRPRPGRPRNLSPAQLCDWLGASARREVSLDRVLLLRTGPLPGIAIRELAAESAEARIIACAFGTSREGSALFPSPSPVAQPAADAADRLQACRELAKSVRCYDFELGIGTEPDTVSEALGSLLS